jgi:hypothetical protein
MSFDSQRWKSNRYERRRMVESLIRSQKLVGLTGSELESILGRPDDSMDGRGPVPGKHVLFWVDTCGVDDLWLDVHLNDRRVDGVICRPD